MMFFNLNTLILYLFRYYKHGKQFFSKNPTQAGNTITWRSLLTSETPVSSSFPRISVKISNLSDSHIFIQNIIPERVNS